MSQETPSAEGIHLREALVIRPGDTLLVVMNYTPMQEMAEQVKQNLMKALPGLADVVVMGPVQQLAVYRPNDASTVNVNVHGSVMNEREIYDAVQRETLKARRRNYGGAE